MLITFLAILAFGIHLIVQYWQEALLPAIPLAIGSFAVSAYIEAQKLEKSTDDILFSAVLRATIITLAWVFITPFGRWIFDFYPEGGLTIGFIPLPPLSPSPVLDFLRGSLAIATIALYILLLNKEYEEICTTKLLGKRINLKKKTIFFIKYTLEYICVVILIIAFMLLAF